MTQINILPLLMLSTMLLVTVPTAQSETFEEQRERYAQEQQEALEQANQEQGWQNEVDREYVVGNM